MTSRPRSRTGTVPDHSDPFERTDRWPPIVFGTLVLLVIAYCLVAG